MNRNVLAIPLLLALAACSRDPEPVAVPSPAAEPATAPEVEAPDVAAAPAALVPRTFSCRGNEPFWALDANADSGLLRTPESESVLSGQLVATGDGAFIFRGAPLDEPESAIEALISPGQCFDTMADVPASPYSAVLGFADGSQGSGCCTAALGLDLAGAPIFEAGSKGEDDWSRLLPDLAGAVLRCTLDAGVATESVSKAWPMNQGKAGVRLRDTSDERYDCVVDLGSGGIESVLPVAGDDTLPGEGNPLWLPAREQSPLLDCGRIERVLSADGLVTGWLHYPEGCPAPSGA